MERIISLSTKERIDCKKYLAVVCKSSEEVVANVFKRTSNIVSFTFGIKT